MIELKHVSKIYNSSSIPAIGFRDISVNFDLGEFVVITGDSGSGKTTLLNVISGLDTYEEGEMFINGINTSDFKQEDFDRYRNEYIGFVFQNYNLIDSYSGVENVMIPLLAKGISREEARSKAIKALKSVGLERQIRTKASKLSGGEKQRTVIARALVSEAPVIVCDEPTGNLDKNTGNDIIKLLGEIAPGRLVIMVNHDYSIVNDVATRHVVIRD